MTWYYKNQILTESPADVQGFVYCITNIVTGQKYIGKKNFIAYKVSVKTITQKNGIKKKKKTKIPVDSDWQTYYGSNLAIQEDVEKLGADKFKRVILNFCKTKGEMSYWETYYIFREHVLLRSDYYNSWVSTRIRRDHIKHLKLEDEEKHID